VVDPTLSATPTSQQATCKRLHGWRWPAESKTCSASAQPTRRDILANSVSHRTPRPLQGSAERFHARSRRRKPMTKHAGRKLLFSHLAGKVTVTSLYLGFTEALFRNVATHVRCTGQREHRRVEYFGTTIGQRCAQNIGSRNIMIALAARHRARQHSSHHGIVAPLWNPVHACVFDSRSAGDRDGLAHCRNPR
jgi:hypothetical protein